MVNIIEAAFPALRPGNYRLTSPPNARYNCIAWAVRDETRWWWPVGHARYYWPDGVAREETLAAFVAAFASVGFRRSDSGDLEGGFEKIAIFTDPNGIPTHAARQVEGGRWTSKLGELDDIEHALRDLEGDMYGEAVFFMKRFLTSSPSATETLGRLV